MFVFLQGRKASRGRIGAQAKFKEKNVVMHEITGLKCLTMTVGTMCPTIRTVGCRTVLPRTRTPKNQNNAPKGVRGRGPGRYHQSYWNEVPIQKKL